jgi:hypothetical protein
MRFANETKHHGDEFDVVILGRRRRRKTHLGRARGAQPANNAPAASLASDDTVSDHTVALTHTERKDDDHDIAAG